MAHPLERPYDETFEGIVSTLPPATEVFFFLKPNNDDRMQVTWREGKAYPVPVGALLRHIGKADVIDRMFKLPPDAPKPKRRGLFRSNKPKERPVFGPERFTLAPNEGPVACLEFARALGKVVHAVRKDSRYPADSEYLFTIHPDAEWKIKPAGVLQHVHQGPPYWRNQHQFARLLKQRIDVYELEDKFQFPQSLEYRYSIEPQHLGD